jgi:uncharacterized membrane protein
MQLLGYVSLAMVVFMHGILLNPVVTNEPIGTGYFFNLLLIGFLLPGLIAGAVHWLARTRRDASYVTALEATTWLLLSGWVLLTVRHLFIGENIGLFQNPVHIAEAFAHTLVSLVIVALVAFAYRFLFANWKSRVLPVALAITIAAFVGNNFLIFMPWQHGLRVGDGFLLNQLLPGFFIPAMLWLTIRHLWKSITDWQVPQLSRILGGLALVSGFAWATFMVRHVWHGTELQGGAFFSTETYAYSAVWLAMGVAILLLSSWRSAQDLRVASAAVIFITVLKVFLYDMAALEGVLRALSFIGLGIVLIAIGLFYQRLLFKDKNPVQMQDWETNE